MVSRGASGWAVVVSVWVVPVAAVAPGAAAVWSVGTAFKSAVAAGTSLGNQLGNSIGPAKNQVISTTKLSAVAKSRFLF